MNKKAEPTETVITRKVPFDLTDSEVALKAKLYADGMTECEAQLLAIKAQAKADTEDVTRRQLDLAELRTQCSTRKEHRVVDCYRDPDLGARVWRIKRCDTGEVVDSKQMTAEEVADMRQLDMIDELVSKATLAEVAPAPPTEAPANDDSDAGESAAAE